MIKKLTSNRFWVKYWSSELVGILVKKRPYFSRLLEQYIVRYQVKSFIEIGGFPGIYPYYLSDKLSLSCSLIDTVVDFATLDRVAEFYSCKRNAIDIIKTDFFKYKPHKKYDLVFSSGFIEHFEDVKKVIDLHLRYVKKGKVIILTIPNYLGLNGYLQKLFSFDHFETHNLRAMDIQYLNLLLSEFKIDNFNIFRYGNSGVWFENLASRPFYLKLLVYFFFALKFPLKLLNINSRLLSPYVIITIIK